MFVSKLQEIAYLDQNSMCPPPEKVNTKGAQKKLMNRNQRSTKRDPSYWEYVDALHSVQNRYDTRSYHFILLVRLDTLAEEQEQRTMLILDQFQPFIHEFIDNIVDVKAGGNCGYRAIATLLGIGEDSWSLVCNYLLKELGKRSYDYIKLFGGTDRFEELRRSLLVDGLSMVCNLCFAFKELTLNKCDVYICLIHVTTDNWMDIIEMRYVIASTYNVILVSLSLQQSMTFFPLRSQPPTDSSVHRIICIGHVYGNHFVQQYRNLMMLKRDYVNITKD
ncbi:hypothetical protein HKD37_12G034615 [Glycine soja]